MSNRPFYLNLLINPDTLEVCNDTKDNDYDDDCEDDPDCKHCTDGDSDGYSLESGWGIEIDCDDTDQKICPGAKETCGDTIGQDCNGKDKICKAVAIEENDLY